MKMKISKKNAKRYRLHRKIRKHGYKLITRKRTIYISHSKEDIIKEVFFLRDTFEYVIQIEIV